MAKASDFLPFFRSRFGSVVIVARAKFAWCHRHNNNPESKSVERRRSKSLVKSKQAKHCRGPEGSRNSNLFILSF